MDPETSTSRKPLRLWPGVVAAVLQSLLMFGLPIVAPDQGGTAVLVGVAGGAVIVLWWLFFSRAAWLERLGAVALMVVAVAATARLVHASIANGMMGFMLPVFAIPVLSFALVVWAMASRRLANGPRRALMVVTILLASGLFTLVRTGGITGDAASDLHWRWTPTPEQRLLARADDAAPPSASAPIGAEPLDSARGGPLDAARDRPLDAARDRPPAAAAPLPVPARTVESAAASANEAAAGPAMSERGFTRVEGPAMSERGFTRVEGPAMSERGFTRVEWAGFRGSDRDGVVRGVRIETDWSRSPPVELWRRPIGPGWSSFAVAGGRLFTQEQRGDDEIVSAYNLTTGKPVWRHRDAARFWESNAGAGPRATPTLSNGRVYTLGGTGILNALDARDGSVVWSRNAASDTGSTVPDWGIASSPVVVGDVVVAATAGSLAAYDLSTGAPRWFGPKDGWGYSSPQLATIDGVAQIVLVNGPGAIGVAPSDGAVLWKYAWGGDSIVQPAVLAGGDVLIGSGSGLGGHTGMLRVTVTHEPLDAARGRPLDAARGRPGEWTVKERWTSTGLKPYFSDFVVHNGHAFGFDGSLLACIDLEDGARKWKGGRYGHGQLVLLPDQDVLLVLSEEGELALVRATPDAFTELARFKAIEGKTWNHPVLAGDVLLVRNGEEMAAFRLSPGR